MRKRWMPMVVVLCLVPVVLGVGPGAIPVYEATTISAAGSYVVTREITSTGNGIVIESSDVTLDLGGHTITGPGYGNGISIGVNATDITIRNGRLRDFNHGIATSTTAPELRLIVESVQIGDVNRGIYIPKPEQVTVSRCRVSNAAWEGIWLGHESVGFAFAARIVGNELYSIGYSGIKLAGINGGTVRDNNVIDYGTASISNMSGIWLGPSSDDAVEAGGTLISGNTITSAAGGNAHAGVYIAAYRSRDLIVDNTLASTGDHGVRVLGDYARVESNHITDVSITAVTVDGYGVIVGNNTLVAANYGINFNGSGGVYRNNVGVDIATVGVQGTATDGGGNIF